LSTFLKCVFKRKGRFIDTLLFIHNRRGENKRAGRRLQNIRMRRAAVRRLARNHGHREMDDRRGDRLPIGEMHGMAYPGTRGF